MPVGLSVLADTQVSSLDSVLGLILVLAPFFRLAVSSSIILTSGHPEVEKSDSTK